MAVRITLIEFFNILKKLFEMDQNVLTQILWIYVFLFHFLSELYWRGCVNNEIYLRANSTIQSLYGWLFSKIQQHKRFVSNIYLPKCWVDLTLTRAISLNFLILKQDRTWEQSSMKGCMMMRCIVPLDFCHTQISLNRWRFCNKFDPVSN